MTNKNGFRALIFGTIMTVSLITVALSDFEFLVTTHSLVVYTFTYLLAVAFAVLAIKRGEDTMTPILVILGLTILVLALASIAFLNTG